MPAKREHGREAPVLHNNIKNKQMKKISQITWMLLIALKLSGQYAWIDSIYTIPNSPTAGDSIMVVGAIRTASAGCDLVNTELEIDTSNNLVKISGCYAIGPMDTICPSIDTFLIGQLQEGNYQIILAVNGFETIVNPNGDCSNSINESVKETEIMVSGTNPTNSKNDQSYQFSLMENPVREFAIFRIKSNEEIIKLVIVDNVGRIVIRKMTEGIYEQEIKIEVKQIPAGIYYCYLENKTGKSKSIKMIKR